MTKAELINDIKNRIGFDTDNETYAMSKDERDFYTSILKILEQDPCDDAVSRKAVMELLDKGYCHKEPYKRKEGNTVYKGYDTYYMINFDKLKALPYVLPKREHGEWIKDDFTGLIKCSRCKNDAPISTVSGTQYESDFCHNCGAEMR